MSFEGVEGESLIAGLPNVAVTTGSACSSASGEPSYVLRALGRSSQLAQSSLRFSLGRGTTETDIDTAAAAVRLQVQRLRSVSPAALHPSAVPENAASHVYEFDSLSPLARRYFDALPGAYSEGAMSPASGSAVIRGEAGSVAQEAWVRFHLEVAGGSVKAALFQAYGCPHTLAAAAWITEQLPGRPRAALVPGKPADWLATLAVPVAKLGRMFIVEDALQAALLHWT